MGLRPTQGNEKHLGPASTLCGTGTSSLSSRPERSGAEGPAVPRTLRGDVFRPERSAAERPAVSFRARTLPGPTSLRVPCYDDCSLTKTRYGCCETIRSAQHRSDGSF